MTDNLLSTGTRGEPRPRFRVGSAPDSWGVWFPDDSRQMPWSRFLDEIARAGYEWLELGPHGYLPPEPSIPACWRRFRPSGCRSQTPSGAT